MFPIIYCRHNMLIMRGAIENETGSNVLGLLACGLSRFFYFCTLNEF